MAPVYEVSSKIHAVHVKGIGSAGSIYDQAGLMELTAQNVVQSAHTDLRNCWILTAIAGLILFSRYAAKVWEYVNRPKSTLDEGLWGLEDLLFFLSFGFHMADMIFLQINQNMSHLSPEYDATNWQFMSQPLSVAAATLARSGMIWYLCQSQSLGDHSKKIRPWLITLMSIHFAFNIIPCLYDMLQCDPSAFRATGKTEYYQYIWAPAPSQGSLVCGDSRLQLVFSIAQGAVNMSTDAIIVFLTAFEVWTLLFGPAQSIPIENDLEKL